MPLSIVDDGVMGVSTSVRPEERCIWGACGKKVRFLRYFMQNRRQINVDLRL